MKCEWRLRKSMYHYMTWHYEHHAALSACVTSGNKGSVAAS